MPKVEEETQEEEAEQEADDDGYDEEEAELMSKPTRPKKQLPPMPQPPKLPPKPKQEKTSEVIWSLRTVPIESQTVIFNEQQQKAYTLEQAIIEILNRLEE